MRVLQKTMFPEVEDQLREREDQMAQILDEELQYVWLVQKDSDGGAQGQKLHWDDAPESLKDWARNVGLGRD